MTNDLEALLDIGLAALLAAPLGLERELARKPAGLRTHILVAVAVGLFISVGEQLLTFATDDVTPDPMRMLEAVATAVTFLGAGTIVFRRQKGVVEGLTTAASLLLVAAIALAATLDLRILATAVTGLSLTVLIALRAFERRLERAAP